MRRLHHTEALGKEKKTKMTIIICPRCGIERRRYAKGLCSSCYVTDNITDKTREKLKISGKRWRDKNPDYMAKYWTKNPDKYKKHIANIKKNIKKIKKVR